MELKNAVKIGTREDVLKTAYDNQNVFAVWVSDQDPEFENEAQSAVLDEIGLEDEDYFAKLEDNNSSIATLTVEPGYSAQDLVDNLSMFMGMVVLTDIRIFVSNQADLETIQKHFCVGNKE
jgi:hypothetical protein